MEPWPRERILALARRPETAAAAPGVAVRARWPELGQAGGLVWGRYAGSGSTPYRTAALTSEAAAFSCTCPSRIYPCKHALGLLLLWADGIAEGDPPAYAVALRERARPLERPQRAGPTADPGAAAARSEARAARVADGLDELERWLVDRVRGGLAGLEHAGYAELDAVAARLVDAQAPGVAGMVRALAGELVGQDWPARVLDRLAALYLLVQAHRRLADLPADLAATVRSRVGYPVSKADVLAGPGVSDHWRAVGQVDAVEYRLESRRVWLWGERTGRWACLLSFTPPGGPLDDTVLVGHRLCAELHFYPGSGQLRALVGERSSVRHPPERPEPMGLSAVRVAFARLLAGDPWASRLPVVVAGHPVPPRSAGQGWVLRDLAGEGCALTGLGAEPWPLLARSAAGLVAVTGEWNGRALRPLGMLEDDAGLPFDPVVAAEAA